MLPLVILEGGEERFGLLGRDTVHSHSSYEKSLTGKMTCSLADMPPDHLKFGLFDTRRGHSRRLRALCGSDPC